MTEKVAFRIQELVASGPLSRSALYDLIKMGQLPARKCGRSTIILAADWNNFLTCLPMRISADVNAEPPEVDYPYGV